MSSKDREKKLTQPHAKTFEYFFKEKETATSLLKVRIWELYLKQNKEAKYLPVIIPTWKFS